MSYIGESVNSKSYGAGTIIEFDNKSGKAGIKFGNTIKYFMFPQALKSEITIAESIKNKIIAELNSNTKQDNTPYNPKPNFYYVFQGKEFESESKSGIIWAPYGNKHFWERLKYLKKGDILLHGCNGYIYAISVVKDSFYEAPTPIKHYRDDYENMLGRQVNCSYEVIRNPIKTSWYKDQILQYNNKTNYPPFNKNGTGMQGYLFNIHPDLARFFIKETVKRNPILINVEFIKNAL